LISADDRDLDHDRDAMDTMVGYSLLIMDQQGWTEKVGKCKKKAPDSL